MLIWLHNDIYFCTSFKIKLRNEQIMKINVHIVELSLSLRFQFEFRLKNIVRLSTSYVNNVITQLVGKQTMLCLL